MILKIVGSLVKIIPALTHPISLIAFSLFVVVYLTNRLLLKSNLIPSITKKHGFKILDKILNISGACLLLIIILAFLSYSYSLYLTKQTSSTRDELVKEITDQIKRAAEEKQQDLVSLSSLQLLRVFRPLIYKLGKNLDHHRAYQIVKRLQEQYGIPELTPALLATSSFRLFDLYWMPFNYLPTTIKPGDYWGHGALWNLGQVPIGGYWQEPIPLRFDACDPADWDYVQFMSKLYDDFPYKDIVYFLAGIDPSLWGEGYEDSPFIEAAYYVQIRIALANGHFQIAIENADCFKKLFPDHKHLDDAFTLKTVAYKLSGNPVQAFLTSIEGMKLADGDMKNWFAWELFRISERYANIAQIEKIIDINPVPKLNPMLLYTKAHHLACKGNYKAAARILSDLISKYPNERVCHHPDYFWKDKLKCLRLDEVQHDLEKFEKLSILQENNSPDGLFQLGCYIYNTDLIHYNNLFRGNRRRARERVCPIEYYQLRNNFYLASKYFSKVVNVSNNPDLVQKAFYKLGRCYEHLSYSSSFYTPAYYDENIRKEFAKKSIRSFLMGYKIHPSGSLADDCLAEAALQSSIKDLASSIRLLNKVIREYEGANAVDNSLYHLAKIYEECGEWHNAFKTWTKLCRGAFKEYWKEIGCDRCNKIADYYGQQNPSLVKP